MTFAELFNPKTKEEIENIGGYYLEENKMNIKLQKNQKIFLIILKIDDSILNEVIGCEKCGRGYKIIEMELRFVKMQLPCSSQMSILSYK